MALSIICSYCRKDMGTKEGGDGITHSCCPECLSVVMAEIETIPIEEEGPYD